MSKPGRNDPCPCGSGKKHKQCCGGKEVRSSALGAKIALGAIALVVLVALSFAFKAYREGGGAPTAYEYDAVENRYWDPDHGHWHDGAPPGGAPAESSGPTPEPWAYNERTNQHWNPDHGHWDDGLPPLESGVPAAIAGDVATRGLEPPPPVAPAAPAQTREPKPWEYDVANDRHWNPDERRWLPGPPISEAE